MATQKNFVVKNGLTVGSVEVIDSSGEITAAALGTSTTENIQDTVGAMVVGGTNITATYDDGAGTLTLDADLAGDIEGVTAGSGLTGGGASGELTVNVGAGNGITVNADDIEIDTSVVTDLSTAQTLTNKTLTSPVLNTGVSGTAVLDDDTFATATATTLASSESIKAYVDAQDTDDVAEGSTNLYHTSERVDDRVNALLTAGTGITLTYDDGADTLTIAGAAQYGDTDVTTHLSDFNGSIIPDTDVTYDLGSSTKQWRDVYVGPGSLYVNGQKVLEDSSGTIVVSADSDQNLQMKTAGSGDIEFNPSGTGIIQAKGTLQMLDGELITNSAGNAVAFGSGLESDSLASRSSDTNLVLSGNGTGIVTVNDSLTVTGNLTVSGTTTTVNSETISLADNTIALNSNFTSGTPTEDAGLSITRGSSTAKTFLWDETNDKWTVGSETMVAATFEGALTGNVTGDVTGNADSATALETARTIGGVSFDGTANINLPGVNTTGDQDTSGNAASATVLETARTIGGVSFNGSANIDLPGVNTTGDQNTSGTAAAWTTARTITLGGDLTGNVSVDGSANATLTATIAANSVALGTDTTGNFVGGISGTTNEIEVSGSGSENATVTIGLPDNVTISGTSTLTGKATTGFTTIGSSDGALRNTFIHSAAPTSGDGAVGDVWITYA
jgi:hypothetical protein